MLVASASVSRKTRLASAIPVIGRSHRGSLVIVLSDFLTLDPVGLWRRASRRHDLTAIRIVDPRETQVPPAGLLSLIDSETGKRTTFDAGSRRNRDDQAALARRQSRLFLDWCGDAGLSALTLSTADDPLGPLLLYFRARGAASASSRNR